MVLLFPRYFPSRAWRELNRHAIEIEGEFVSSDAFFLRQWIGPHQHRITFRKREIRIAHKNTTKLWPRLDVFRETEPRPECLLFQQHLPRIKTKHVDAIPHPVVILFFGM